MISISELEKFKALVNLSATLQYPFDEIQNHLNAVQILLKEESETITKNPDEAITNQNPYMIFGLNYSNPLEFKELFPSIERNALFITSLCIFEDLLRNICLTVSKIEEDNENVSRWRGNILRKSTEYICSYNILNEIDLQDDYNIINSIRIIRNCFVHCNGILFEDDSEHRGTLTNIRNKIDILGLVQLKESSEGVKVSINDFFFHKNLLKLHEFLIKIHDAIYKHYIKLT